MSHFPIPYAGSKRLELKHLAGVYDPSDFDTVVEPFAGSSSFSFDLWSRHPGKKYVLGDTSGQLVEFCNEILGKHRLEELQEWGRARLSDSAFRSVLAGEEGTPIQRYYYKAAVCRYHSNLPPHRWPRMKMSRRHAAAQEFYEANPLLLQGWETTVAPYLGDPRALVFLDPPYVTSWNGAYEHDGGIADDEGEMVDPTGIYVRFRELIDDPDRLCAFLLVSNAPAILEDYFKNLPGCSVCRKYPKAYGSCLKRKDPSGATRYVRKKTKHMVVYAPPRRRSS